MKQIIIRTLRNGVACVSVALLIGAGIMPMPAQADTIRGPTWVHTFSARNCLVSSLHGSVYIDGGNWVNPADVAYSSSGFVNSIGSGSENAFHVTCLNVNYLTNAQSDLCILGALGISGLVAGSFYFIGTGLIVGAPLTAGGSIFAGAAVVATSAVASGWVYHSLTSNHQCELRIAPQ